MKSIKIVLGKYKSNKKNGWYDDQGKNQTPLNLLGVLLNFYSLQCCVKGCGEYDVRILIGWFLFAIF